MFTFNGWLLGGNIRDGWGASRGNARMHQQLAATLSVDSMLLVHPDCNCVCRFVQSGRAGRIAIIIMDQANNCISQRTFFRGVATGYFLCLFRIRT